MRVFENDKNAKKLLKSLNYKPRPEIKPTEDQDIVASNKLLMPLNQQTQLMTLITNASGV